MNWNYEVGKPEIESELLRKYENFVKKNYSIEQSLYEKYNVKRGLRNADSTGVLVGLTQIGDVHAYIINEMEKVPVEGILTYRGIDVRELVEGFQKENRFGFEECCYLLLFGELPSKSALDEFNRLLGENRALPEEFTRDMFLKTPSGNIMNKLSRSVLACYMYDSNPEDNDPGNVIRQSINLIAGFPAMIAYAYQSLARNLYGDSLHIHSPLPDKSTAENLLHMIRSDGKYTKLEAEVLDLALVLHAEHGGGNNSTFTTHVVSSTGTDTYSAISAALGSLKGPLHGGANIKVMEMMEDIKEKVKDWEDEDEVCDYLIRLLNKQEYDRLGLIYGIGHAVYTLSDPRAIMLKGKAAELAKVTGMEKEYSLYERIEKLAPVAFNKYKNTKDRYLCANVDFFSGFVYKMLNIPADLYTPIFACGRICGWAAHRLEEIMNGGKIIRPAYKNVGEKMEYVRLKDR
ncbi:MAG TPA: citrate/2-methylcitrate synthase [Clostridia bacterium]|nr:citrate/2-methylcitrate synthase [Clostridia bacterium]